MAERRKVLAVPRHEAVAAECVWVLCEPESHVCSFGSGLVFHVGTSVKSTVDGVHAVAVNEHLVVFVEEVLDWAGLDRRVSQAGEIAEY